ncbi:hypothetical protein [Paenibacillus piri]|uniref:Zinc-finger domain-containing protein n=1 Tax=Paenibacillus piri TaxID=2547395 RepID=A0A4V2ZSK4_9BACL|nr:hypothetical protein [Paenibacillus piri]TDF93574.1 hypothetical protein E1757_26985 [Paenibacillus piri]
MKHYTLEQWDRYTGAQLPDEECAAYEAHLSSCEPCFELYMQSLERAAASYPALEDGNGLADAVMSHIEAHAAPSSPASPPIERPQLQVKRWRALAYTRHPAFHYGVAAAITILLMSSGAFQSMMERLTHLEPATLAIEQEQGMDQTQTEQAAGRIPVSYKIMEKTIFVLDSIQPRHDKGGSR